MKPIQLFRLLTIVCLICNFSCQKDDGLSGNNNPQETIPDTFSEYFGNEISRDFLGTVIDKNHNPIEGATITIGNETALTDSNGVFIIRDANVNERFGFVKAEKAGYIHASRSVAPSNGTNKVTIMMLDETVVGTVSSGSPSTVTIDGGSSVSFDGNFIKEDGSAYEGSVDVIMHHLDPTNEDMSLQMPGMLYAENEDGAERMLQTLGMLAVELRGSSGEDLNLAEGSTSEIIIPVDASLMNIAPATIPLWYFDEANGYWKEEGVATLQGNMYVGTVSHFSFWNCDIPAEAIMLCVEVLDEDGNELDLMNVTIFSEIFGTTNGITNEKGEVCGLVPSNESLSLNIFVQNSCNATAIYTENIGPFIADSNITITISTNSEIVQETVVGTFNTCDGNPVENGYVILTYGNQSYIDTVINGEFEINLLRCAENNTFSIKGVDFNNLQLTTDINYTYTSPITNIGVISACNSIIELIFFTVDGINTSFYSDIDVIIEDGVLSIEANTGFYGGLIELNAPAEEGPYIPNTPQIGILRIGQYLGNNAFSSHSTPRDIEIFINKISNIGDYIDLNFTANIFRDFEYKSVTGIIHVIRDQ